MSMMIACGVAVSVPARFFWVAQNVAVKPAE